MSDFFRLVQQRESCRNYQPGRYPTREQLVHCVEAARLAPSACNSQPWSFIVANHEAAAKVAPCVQSGNVNRFAENCPAFIVIFEEPAILMGGQANQKYAQIDLGIATAHLCYAATEQGLSTCIMGSFNQQQLLETLGLPADKTIRLVLAIGYSADEHLRDKKRKPLDEIMTSLD